MPTLIEKAKAAEEAYEALEAKRFPVVEIFGPTIQGEGALAGSVSHFIRFGGCDYACKWCDSAHAVLPEEVRKAERLSRAEILARIEALPPAQWVTLSGGNPALHDLELVVDSLRLGDSHFRVAVETQGSLWKPWLNNVDQLTISPKPPSSGMATPEHWLAFQAFMRTISATTHPIIKVPIFSRLDFDWAVNLHMIYSWYPFYLSVVTRMGGLRGDFDGGAIDEVQDVLDSYNKVARWTLEEPSMRDVRVIPQLHVLLWGHERGR